MCWLRAPHLNPPSPAPCQMEPRDEKTSVQVQSMNAQTPSKTEENQRPESKTNQQLSQPYEICKTSTPGSNPDGASNFPKKNAGLWRCPTRFDVRFECVVILALENFSRYNY